LLRRISEPKRVEVTEEGSKLQNEKFHDLYCSPNFFFQPIISIRKRWAGYVACIEERKGVYRVLVGKAEGKSALGRTGSDGRMILRWVFMFFVPCIEILFRKVNQQNAQFSN